MAGQWRANNILDVLALDTGDVVSALERYSDALLVAKAGAPLGTH